MANKKKQVKGKKKYNSLELLLEEVERKMRPLGNPIGYSGTGNVSYSPTRGKACAMCCSSEEYYS